MRAAAYVCSVCLSTRLSFKWIRQTCTHFTHKSTFEVGEFTLIQKNSSARWQPWTCTYVTFLGLEHLIKCSEQFINECVQVLYLDGWCRGHTHWQHCGSKGPRSPPESLGAGIYSGSRHTRSSLCTWRSTPGLGSDCTDVCNLNNTNTLGSCTCVETSLQALTTAGEDCEVRYEIKRAHTKHRKKQMCRTAVMIYVQPVMVLKPWHPSIAITMTGSDLIDA